jgi:hypothetical protein
MPKSASSNLVRVAFIPETVYGETPVAGNFETARFTSETLSASPNTVESKQIRTDRMSSGQIVTGLDVNGPLAFELAKETQLEAFMESLFYSTWQTLSLATVDLSYNSATRELTRATGSWLTDIKKGDVLKLAGFTNTVNNTDVMITSVDSATVVKISGPVGLVTEAGSGTSYKRFDKLEIGLTKKSFSVQKEFTDLTEKAIIYRGMIVGSMDFNVAFGELITGSIGLSGNDYQVVSDANDFITDGRTINPPANSQTFNGSIDMPFVASGAIGVFGPSDFAIKNVSLKIDNNLTPQNVIGRIAARDFTVGTCKIDVDMSAYLDDSSWAIMPKKLSQDPFEIGFMVRNSGGKYGFYMPALQASFEDPNSGGQNQDIMFSLKGMAKVGPTGESALTIYRAPA